MTLQNEKLYESIYNLQILTMTELDAEIQNLSLLATLLGQFSRNLYWRRQQYLSRKWFKK